MRTRRFALALVAWGGLVLAAVAAVLWPIGHVVRYEAHLRIATDPRPDTQPGWFLVRVWSLTASNWDGRLVMSLNDYTSGLNDRDKLARQWPTEWYIAKDPGPRQPLHWWRWGDTDGVRVLGAGYASRPVLGGTTRVALLPWWVVIVLGATPWAMARFSRRRRRLSRGECVRCGYDRRGTPANAACPECGCAGPRIDTPRDFSNPQQPTR